MLEIAACQLFSEYPGGLWQWPGTAEQQEPLQSQEEYSDAMVQSQELLNQSEKVTLFL